jgi:putative hydrolase of the HAD superfamily
LRDCGLAGFFDSVHISTRVGAAKPAPAIFEVALNYHRIKPSQAWHVGDSLREDVEGALAVGLQGCLIDRGGERPPEVRYVSLSSLLQLPEMC